jgi:hypothetical protein
MAARLSKSAPMWLVMMSMGAIIHDLPDL